MTTRTAQAAPEVPRPADCKVCSPAEMSLERFKQVRQSRDAFRPGDKVLVRYDTGKLVEATTSRWAEAEQIWYVTDLREVRP